MNKLSPTNKIEFPQDIWNHIKSYMLVSSQTHLDRVFENRLREYLQTKSSLNQLQDAYTQLISSRFFSVGRRGIRIISNTKIPTENRKKMVVDYICEFYSRVIYDNLNSKVNSYMFNNTIPFKIRPFLYLWKINDIVLIDNNKCIVVNKAVDYIEVSRFQYRDNIGKAYENDNNKIRFLTNIRRLIWTTPSTNTLRFYNYVNIMILEPTNPLYYNRNIDCYTSGEDIRVNNGYGKYVM
jgi:hypothetical protein